MLFWLILSISPIFIFINPLIILIPAKLPKWFRIINSWKIRFLGHYRFSNPFQGSLSLNIFECRQIKLPAIVILRFKCPLTLELPCDRFDSVRCRLLSGTCLVSSPFSPKYANSKLSAAVGLFCGPQHRGAFISSKALGLAFGIRLARFIGAHVGNL